MENIAQSTAASKRKSSSGPFMRAQKKLRVSGKAYKTGFLKDKQEKRPPEAAVSLEFNFL